MCYVIDMLSEEEKNNKYLFFQSSARATTSISMIFCKSFLDVLIVFLRNCIVDYWYSENPAMFSFVFQKRYHEYMFVVGFQIHVTRF